MFRSQSSSQRQTSLRSLARRRLTLESLEHRTLLATMAEVTFAATDLLGQSVTTLVQGREYYLNATVKDVRTGGAATGVQSAYFDLAVNNNGLLSVVDQTGAVGGVVFSPLYPNSRSGANTIETVAQEINEVGASTTEAYFDANVQLFQMRFRADAAGTLTFSSNPGELAGSIFSLQGFGPVASADVNFGSLSLPIATAIALTNNTGSVNEDVSLPIDVLSNDTGGAFRWTINAISDISSGGSVAIASNGKSVTYTPAANFSGTETFKYYTVDSNGIFGQATVTVTVNPVNDAPINVVPATVQTYTSTTRTVTFGPLNAVSTSDVDVGEGKLRVTLFVNNGRITLGSTSGVTFRGGANNSKYLLFDATPTDLNNALTNLKYVANTGINSDVLTINTHDLGNTGAGGAGIDQDTVNLALTGTTPNQAPVNSVPGAQTYTSSLRQVTFAPANANAITVNDPDVGTTGKLRVTLFVNSGVLRLAQVSGLTFFAGANNTNYMIFDATQANVNNALVSLRYTANTGVVSDVLTIDTHDLGNTGSGGAKTDRDFVLLSLQGATVNQPPVNTVPGSQNWDTTTRTITFDSTKRVSTNDPDVGTTANLRVTLFVNSGIISLPSLTNLTFVGGANNSRYLLFDGKQVDINAALLNMQYIASTGVTSDVFTIDVHDLGNSGSGGAKTDRDTISLFQQGFGPNGRSGNGGSGEAGSSAGSNLIAAAGVSASDRSSDSAISVAAAVDSVLADTSTTTLPLTAQVNTSAVRLADLLASTNSGRARVQKVTDSAFSEGV